MMQDHYIKLNKLDSEIISHFLSYCSFIYFCFSSVQGTEPGNPLLGKYYTIGLQLLHPDASLFICF